MRRKEYNEKKKENAKDVKSSRDIINNVDNVIFLFGLKMTEGNITYVYMLDILWIVITLIRLRKRSTRNNFQI